MVRKKISDLVKKSIKELQKEEKLPVFDLPEIKIEHPRNKKYGDYSTNVSMLIAKDAKLRASLVNRLITVKLLQLSDIFESIDSFSQNGKNFINFYLKTRTLQKEIKKILKEKEKFGNLNIGKKKKAQVEFISANPTGPLTLGNGRGGFCGDTLANVFKKGGYEVEREYYINDVGEQIKTLGYSVIGHEKGAYKGKYINDLRKKIKGKDPDRVGQKAAKIILKELIRPSVKKMGIKFDVWFSEKSLYQKGKIKKILDYLRTKRLVYEKEGALWFKSSQYGDDKDRVLIKSDGNNTYLLSDIAYLKDKIDRGFKKLIYFWGADHYGYVDRMKAAARALGHKKVQADFIIMQLVAVVWAGQRQRMSKRKGVYWGIDELIKKLNLDVVRFLFLTRAPESHLIFDLDLAKEKSEKNPVYYVQYAHARMCSILKKTKGRKFKFETKSLKLLKHERELDLIKELIRFPEVIEDICYDYQVQKLPQYATDLAAGFHRFYQECQVLNPNKELQKARISLLLCTQIVLKETFKLMGISAPEKM
jgi:arginyl-tRNA synthetase